ncbi:MAG: bifunctional glutamate N-acetyltransferase/amino-acid acetyltransferase ArgJ [Eubacteriales bacterium]
MNLDKLAIKEIKGGVAFPMGFIACGVKAGIKSKTKYDMALIQSEVQAQAAGVFTRNVVKAHPLMLTRKHLMDGTARAVIVNSGNANACMGELGDKAALEMAKETADKLGIALEDVIVASTGVIGEEMPMDKIKSGIVLAVNELKCIDKSDEGLKGDYANKAALAIMTTDTIQKEKAYELKCSIGSIRMGIMAKGSGMIHPNMGTMLSFITTDALVEADILQKLLKEAVDETFNMITVDGDTSTNDMAVILANGMSGFSLQGEELKAFGAMLKKACQDMAIAIARDGEGASKLIEAQVKGAASLEDARKIVRSVCSSSLVKSAIYGEDANWGRIIAAAGYSGAIFDPWKVNIFLGNIQVAKNGQGLKFSEIEAKELLMKDEIIIRIELGDGGLFAKGWGCDLTHKYVDINASYRS